MSHEEGLECFIDPRRESRSVKGDYHAKLAILEKNPERNHAYLRYVQQYQTCYQRAEYEQLEKPLVVPEEFHLPIVSVKCLP